MPQYLAKNTSGTVLLFGTHRQTRAFSRLSLCLTASLSAAHSHHEELLWATDHTVSGAKLAATRVCLL
jgi:hypothetical protein